MIKPIIKTATKLLNRRDVKSTIIIAIAVILVFTIYIVSNSIQFKSSIEFKIIGWSTVDNSFSIAERNSISYALLGNFKFPNRKVKLPYSVYDFKKNKIQSLNREVKEYGNWIIISRRPDSIQIEDCKAFFSGRYGVEFGIAKAFPGSHHPDTLWVLLSNDSTHIVLNKLSSSVPYELYRKWLE